MFVCRLFQAIAVMVTQLDFVVTQSGNVFKQSVTLHSEQIGEPDPPRILVLLKGFTALEQ